MIKLCLLCSFPVQLRDQRLRGHAYPDHGNYILAITCGQDLGGVSMLLHPSSVQVTKEDVGPTGCQVTHPRKNQVRGRSNSQRKLKYGQTGRFRRCQTTLVGSAEATQTQKAADDQGNCKTLQSCRDRRCRHNPRLVLAAFTVRQLTRRYRGRAV